MSIRLKQYILLTICLLALGVAVFAPRLAQNPLYHLFADQRTLLEIPNALNVLSNLIFAWAGIDGLYRLRVEQSLQLPPGATSAYTFFFSALILVAAGSGYYHWSPGNQTLIWDRLPMTIAFMSFFSVILAERVSPQLARRLFPSLLVAGIGSVLYWHFSEIQGRGDLRPYALVQFLPMLLTPLILLLFASRYTLDRGIWWFFAWYLAAKILEAADQPIYDWAVVISGHSLKHIAAGIACLVFLRHLRLREPLKP